MLTAGKDSIVKLWELAVGGRCLVAYTGAGSGGMPQEFNVRAQLNHAEDYGMCLALVSRERIAFAVMFPDEKSCSMCSWDARTAERKRLLPLGKLLCVMLWLSCTSLQDIMVQCAVLRIRQRKRLS